MDRLDAIQLFVRVVERGSFSAAAREAGIGQSAASKQVAALETHLGGPLLQRTSRKLAVTEAGKAFYDAALRLLDDVSALESLVGSGQSSPSGLVRVAVAPVFGRLYIVPHLAEFLGRYPDLRVEIYASDRRVDMIEEGIDLAIRHGDLGDSSLTMRKLATSPFVTVATPGYLDRCGTPATPGDLRHHACLGFTQQHEVHPWVYAEGGVLRQHHPEATFRTNDGEQLRAAVLGHLGITHVPAWIVAPELASGAVRVVLQDYESEALAISVVYPERRRPAAKIRVFIDFLAASFARDAAGRGLFSR